MKITDAKVFVGGPGKNYVTLKIMTDLGVYGLGDATLNNRETLPAAQLQDYLIPCLIGMDPCRSEDIWQYFYRGAYFRRGPIAMAAFGAIDMALWDLKGKLAKELIDFIRVAVTYAGGITPVKRIVDLAGLHHVRTGFHGAPSHSQLCMAAQADLNAWAPNFGIQEYLVLGTSECDALFPSDHRMKNGMVYVSDAPGLSVDFDETEAARAVYNPGSYPVVRLEDGALWNY